MEKVKVGKIVSTHGIQGEIKILSQFPWKERVFQVGNRLWMDDQNYEIKTYRVHKGYDMVTLDHYHNINEVLFLMKKDVYFDKAELNLTDEEVLDEDLISFEVLTTEGKRGIIKEIFFASPTNKILRIWIEKKEILIPMFSPMVKKIDKEKKEILIEQMKGL